MSRRAARVAMSTLLLMAGLTAVPRAAASEPAAAAWRAITPPPSPHPSDHTATRLMDGRILVVGGVRPGNYARGGVTGADLYDPATGGWSATRPTAVGRQYHTATLLNDGRVLVAGGYGDDAPNFPTETEIYDPASGGWRVAGSMATGRVGHSATLLTDGRVLVAGGYSASPTTVGDTGSRPTILIDSTEIYDPATDRWTPRGPLGLARAEHTATLLPDGSVLVAGGRGGSGAPGADPSRAPSLRACELFNPATGTWIPSPHLLTTARAGHTASVLANGTVLLAGGSTQEYHGGSGLPTASAEIYSPTTRAFTATHPLIHPRLAHTATALPDGRLLVTGGLAKEREGRIVTVVPSAEVYDPATGSWSEAPAPALPTTSTSNRNLRIFTLGGYHTATLLQPAGATGGTYSVLVVGSTDGRSAQIYGTEAAPRTAASGRSWAPVIAVALAVAALAVAGGLLLARRRRP